MMKSSLMRINLIFILLFLFIPNLTSAESKTFVKEYTYQASELDSKTSCKAIATEQLKRTLLEELGTYLESKTVVKDSQLDKDEITTLTAGVVQVAVMDETWDGKVYWLKAQVKADPDEVAASINKLKNDEHLVHDLEEARAESAQAMEEAEDLRKQLAQATADKQKQEQYNDAMKQLAAADYFERGSAFATAGNYKAAASAYDNAIIMEPEYAKAYINRSILFVQLGAYDRAANDLKMAAALDPSKQETYYTRIEHKKRLRERDVGAAGQIKAKTQGSRYVDPLQRLLDWKREERRKVALRGSPEKSITVHAGQSTGLSKEEKRKQQALLRKERELRRKQMIEELRKKREMQRLKRKKAPAKEKDKDKK
jgi:tetratricopeptide (TPR) repeat protein/competence protein ComGC